MAAFDCLFALLLWLVCLVQAQVVPFSIDGTLEAISADTADFNTGGTVTVEGMKIVIPKNLQVQFPAAFIPFKQMAAGSFLGHETSITGNYVNGVAIAGLFRISKLLLESNQGTIKSLAFDGAITMDNGQVIRINDPNAVFSAGYTALPEFTADDKNPSVSSFSGFPMCVPRSATDTACPSRNRPVQTGVQVFEAPDPWTMAPLQVGDYLTYSGVRVGGELICYTIIAESVQILTPPGGPAYIRIEDAIIGVVDGSSPINVEFADTRFIGYTSDRTVDVTISRIDIDPCTGDISHTTIGTASPANTGPRNKFVFRSGSTIRTPYTREYNITGSSGTHSSNGGQIIAGQWVQPVGDWIFPENAQMGIIPPKNDFSSFTYLVNGLGPDPNAPGDVWGPLSPFPDSTAPRPNPATCPTTGTGGTGNTGGGGVAPLASAGTSQTVRPGTAVVLQGSVSNAASFPTGDLVFAWSQTAGPTIALAGTSTSKASFQAPAVSTITTATFRLAVNSTSKATRGTSDVDVVIDPNGRDTVTIDSYTWTNQKGGTLTVTAHTNVVDGSATLSLIVNNPGPGGALSMVSTGQGKFSFTSRSLKQPSAGVTVRSNFGGSDTKTATTL